MTTTAPRLDDATWREGLDWQAYLEASSNTRAMQQKRYDQTRSLRETGQAYEAEQGLRALLLCEERCGDCAWAIPQLVKLLEGIEGLETRLFLRGDHPRLQDELLTNGKRSVPKLAILSAQGELLGQWGPRPAPIQAYVEKSVRTLDKSEWRPRVLSYYREQGAADLETELVALLEGLSATKKSNTI